MKEGRGLREGEGVREEGVEGRMRGCEGGGEGVEGGRRGCEGGGG